VQAFPASIAFYLALGIEPNPQSSGKADVNPVQDLGFWYAHDLSDQDGRLWCAFWMDMAAMPGAAQTCA